MINCFGLPRKQNILMTLNKNKTFENCYLKFHPSFLKNSKYLTNENKQKDH